MPDENKFFRFVWRFNALAIALAVLATLGLLGYALVSSFTRDYWVMPQGHFAPVPKGAEAKNTYRLRSSGSVAFVKNGGGEDVYLAYSLGAWEGEPNAYGLESVSRISKMREPDNSNLLLVNARTGAGVWLFKGLGRNILNWDKVIDPSVAEAETGRPQILPAHEFFGDVRHVKAVVLKVVERDSNQDGDLTEDDGVSLYAWRLGDNAPVKILEASLLLGQNQIGADRYSIAYEVGDQAWLAVFSVPDFKLLSKTKLPKVPE